MADSRFFPWFKLELEALPAIPPADATPVEVAKLTSKVAELAAALETLLPIDRNFYEADIKVTMRYALVGNSFEITIAGLNPTVHDVIEVGQTGIKIALGYYAGLDNLVLEGVIQKKEIKAGECFYETTLKGVEKSYHVLQSTCLGSDGIFPEDTDILDILEEIEEKSDVTLSSEGVAPGEETRIPRQWSHEKKSALFSLDQVQRRLHRIGGYSLLLRDGQIWYRKAGEEQNNAGEVRDPVYSYDNYLVKTDEVNETRRGRSRGPCAPPVKKKPPPLGYTFEMLGDPRLRPGDTLKFKIKTKKDEVKEVPLTIESITHDFSREKGYRCTGRALRAEQFLEHVFEAMAPGAETVGEEVNNLLARNQERFPTVNVGDITEYTAEVHLANAKLGLEFEPTVTSPSVQVRLGAEGFNLQQRPLVAPFAWNLCGLVVPVYAGMRAVAVHNRYLREDALLNGFIWTEEMAPPPNEAGDYWLCLPLDVPDDRAPNNSDKAANDLTTGDGKRVIQLKGLRITIGEGSLPNLGTRPDNVGADNELQIEHSSGAKITLKDSEIRLEAGGRTVDISGGKVKIS